MPPAPPDKLSDPNLTPSSNAPSNQTRRRKSKAFAATRSAAQGHDLAVWHHSNLFICLYPHQRTGRACRCAECLGDEKRGDRAAQHGWSPHCFSFNGNYAKFLVSEQLGDAVPARSYQQSDVVNNDAGPGCSNTVIVILWLVQPKTVS